MSENLKDKKSIAVETDIEILKKLRQYDERSRVLCLECGYDGLMGVEGKHIPWYVTWWVLIPIILTGVGIIVAVALGFLRASLENEIVRCPNCDSQLS